MALVLADRVRETSTTTGTGTFTLDGAVTGFQSFAAVGNANTTYYTIAGPNNNEWEVGIGTYTASGTTLSRDTILDSSNSGSAVNFTAGEKQVFVVYPADKTVNADASDTVNISTLAVTSGTISSTPSADTDLVNKLYVDTIAAESIHYHTPVDYETPVALPSNSYNNGSSGVGATLTATANGTLSVDGQNPSVSDRILVYQESNAAHNGVYTVTDTGSGSTQWVLTRATDADSYAPVDSTALGQGSGFFVTGGDTGAGETYVCNTEGVITFGTTDITFAQVSATQIYTAGTGLTLSSTEFSLTTPVALANGGTGSTTASGARTNLGLGTIATQAANNVAITGGTISGINTFSNSKIERYREDVTASTISSTSHTLDLATANIFELTMNSSITSLTISNPPSSGEAYSFTVIVKQDGTGSRTISWPASVKFPNASTPTLTTTPNKVDILNFITTDGGTTYYGALSLANL